MLTTDGIAIHALQFIDESTRLAAPVIAATDPLHFTNIVASGPRVSAHPGNRLSMKDGRLIAALQARAVHCAINVSDGIKERLTHALRLQVPPLRDQLLNELRPTGV